MGVRKAVLDKAITAADPLDNKSSVRVVTTQALPAYARVDNVITANVNGAMPSIDGVTLAVGDDLLLKDGASAVDNGIYTVTAVGSGGAPFSFTRRGDADTTEFVNSGLNTIIEEGAQYGGQGTRFALITPNPITLNVTALEFQEVAGGGGGAIVEQIDAPAKINTEAGKITPIMRRLGGDGAVDGDGVLRDISYDENFTHFHIPFRMSVRVPDRQQMLYKGIPLFDGMLIADGIVTEAVPSAEELLEILGTVLDLDEILMGGGSPAVARGPAEARARLDVYSRAEADAVAGDGRVQLWWNGSSNADGSQSGSDSNHDVSFTAEVGRINKWLSQFAGIVATLPVVGTENHNRRIAFFDNGNGLNTLDVVPAGGDAIYDPRIQGTTGTLTIQPGTMVVLQGDWSTLAWKLVEVLEPAPLIVTAGQINEFVGAPIVFSAGSLADLSGVNYLTPGGDGAAPGVAVKIDAPRSGKIKKLRVRHTLGAGNGNNIVYTVRKNGVPTGITVSVSSSSTVVVTGLGDETFADGDTIDVQADASSGIGSSPSYIVATLLFDSNL